MSERLDRTATEFADALKVRWPLEEMLGADLIAAAQRRIESRLELRQHPSDVLCRPEDDRADFGCSVDEVEALVTTIVRRHADDLRALGEFARRKDNRLYVVPGNHDAGLLEDRAWHKLSVGLGVSPTKAVRVASGRWISADGRIAVEHGHQIGRDVNRFPDWPTVTALYQNEHRMVRTWGERFVQKLYNDVEAQYPLIDNLQPVGAGVRLYREERGFVGTGADAVKFLAFNLFDTSLAQKIALKPGEKDQDGPCWKTAEARERGAGLLADSLEPGHPARSALLHPSTEEERALAAAAADLIRDPVAFPDDEVLVLCDTIVIRIEQEGAEATGERLPCPACSGTLGGAILQRIVPENRILSRHLKPLRKEYPELSVFVYGHTHEARAPWDVRVPGGEVTVANCGAFQRLLDSDGLERLAAREQKTPNEVFTGSTLEELPACYSAVRVTYPAASPTVPKAETVNWLVDPETQEGTITHLCDPRCGYRNPKSCGGA
jgi:hypothetical protein